MKKQKMKEYKQLDWQRQDEEGFKCKFGTSIAPKCEEQCRFKVNLNGYQTNLHKN